MSSRRFTREFKLSAIKLVNEQAYSIAEAAKSLGENKGDIHERHSISRNARCALPLGSAAAL